MYPDLLAALDAAKTVFITAHVGPDGDTLGSMLGLKFALEKARPHIQRVDCVISGKMPDVYSFLPGIRTILRMETATTLLDRYDLSISVDCGSLERLGQARPLFEGAVTSANIDHHISNTNFAAINVIEPSAAASGQIVFEILKAMAIPMDANIATCLYTAIVTDTGGFKYSNTSVRVMEITAQLINAGASPDYIFKQLYEEQPLRQVMLQAEALLQTRFESDHRVGWTMVTREQLNRYGADDEHIEGLVESIRRIDTVLIAMVLKETPEGHTKVSMRSDRHDLDVSAMMTRFGGGGHRMAAGCTLETPIAEAPNVLLPVLLESLNVPQPSVF